MVRPGSPVKIKPIPIVETGHAVSTSYYVDTRLSNISVPRYPLHSSTPPEGGVSFIEAILDLGDCRIADLLLAEAGR